MSRRRLQFLLAGWLLLISKAALVAQPSPPEISFATFLCAPVRVHLLRASNAPAVETTLTAGDVGRILAKVNRVWAPAGINFYLDSVSDETAVDPMTYETAWTSGATRHGLLSLRPVSSQATNLFHLYYLKRMTVNGIHFPEGNFVKDTASLRAVPGGIEEPLPRVSSHELGHALTLPHRQDTTNLMASGTTGTWLDATEIARARHAAEKMAWIIPAPKLLERANERFESGHQAEAARWYRVLAGLPGAATEFPRVRERAGPSRP